MSQSRKSRTNAILNGIINSLIPIDKNEQNYLSSFTNVDKTPVIKRMEKTIDKIKEPSDKAWHDKTHIKTISEYDKPLKKPKIEFLVNPHTNSKIVTRKSNPVRFPSDGIVGSHKKFEISKGKTSLMDMFFDFHDKPIGHIKTPWERLGYKNPQLKDVAISFAQENEGVLDSIGQFRDSFNDNRTSQLIDSLNEVEAKLLKPETVEDFKEYIINPDIYRDYKDTQNLLKNVDEQLKELDSKFEENKKDMNTEEKKKFSEFKRKLLKRKKIYQKSIQEIKEREQIVKNMKPRDITKTNYKTIKEGKYIDVKPIIENIENDIKRDIDYINQEKNKNKNNIVKDRLAKRDEQLTKMSNENLKKIDEDRLKRDQRERERKEANLMNNEDERSKKAENRLNKQVDKAIAESKQEQKRDDMPISPVMLRRQQEQSKSSQQNIAEKAKPSQQIMLDAEQEEDPPSLEEARVDALKRLEEAEKKFGFYIPDSEFFNSSEGSGKNRIKYVNDLYEIVKQKYPNYLDDYKVQVDGNDITLNQLYDNAVVQQKKGNVDKGISSKPDRQRILYDELYNKLYIKK